MNKQEYRKFEAYLDGVIDTLASLNKDTEETIVQTILDKFQENNISEDEPKFEIKSKPSLVELFRLTDGLTFEFGTSNNATALYDTYRCRMHIREEKLDMKIYKSTKIDDMNGKKCEPEEISEPWMNDFVIRLLLKLGTKISKLY